MPIPEPKKQSRWGIWVGIAILLLAGPEKVCLMLLRPQLRRELDGARFAGLLATADKLNLLIGRSALSVQLKCQSA